MPTAILSKETVTCDSGGRSVPSFVEVIVVGVENNNWEDQGQRNAKTLMQILGGIAIQP